MRKVFYLTVFMTLLSILCSSISMAEEEYVFVTKWGTEGSGDGQFKVPEGIAVDNSGYVYVADTFNHRIQVFEKKQTAISAKVELKPDEWALKWKDSPSGVAFVNCYIGSTDGSVDVLDVDVSSILLNGTLSPHKTLVGNYYSAILPGRFGFAGEVLSVGFRRRDAIEMLGEVSIGDVVDVTISGNFISGGSFSETQPITVVSGSWRSPEKTIETACYQNYPNPFNPETWIPYQLAQSSEVTVSIYSAAGQLIRTISLGRKAAGFYLSKDSAAYWDGLTDTGERVSSGVYFYTIQAGDFVATKKMVIAQ